MEPTWAALAVSIGFGLASAGVAFGLVQGTVRALDRRLAALEATYAQDAAEAARSREAQGMRLGGIEHRISHLEARAPRP